MKTICKITISNDPMTLGAAATQEDLLSYSKQLAADLSEEFDCDVYCALDNTLQSTATCGDPDLESAIGARLREIERGDEWIEILSRSEEA